MRVRSSVTSVSWIPSEAVPGTMKLPFTLGVSHYDDPPPPQLGDADGDAERDLPAALEAWRAADRFRFANHLSAWADFDDDSARDGGSGVPGLFRVRASGYDGGGSIGSTTLRIAGGSATFAAVRYEDLQSEPVIGDGWVRFTQTVGGRTGAPMPRTVSRPPFVQLRAPTVWTTLQLTLHADGRAEWAVVGASPFPRHWVYDHRGHLVAKSGLTDFAGWSKACFGDHSPWGDRDAPALVTAAETALERELSRVIMREGAKPQVRRIAEGEALVEQGEVGDAVFLLLDGVLSVEVDGAVVAEVGPGAVAGERALLESGVRTSTLRARTPCRVAVAAGADIDREALARLAQGHRREETAAAPVPGATLDV